MKPRALQRLAPAAPLLGALCSCSPAGDQPAAGAIAPPASAVVEEAPLRIRREVFLVDGAKAPPNPATGAATPPELDRVRVVRYRVDADPPRAARAVVVIMPGLLGGAGSVDGLARALVRRSATDGALEAWAIDRRSNLLEDHRGLDLAEVRGDPELARRYYFEGAEAAGARFAGFRSSVDASFASEWGLAVTIGDLRAVINLVDRDARRGRVVLLGHSLGASIAEQYAAWDFDGAPGYADLAALVLVEGAARAEGEAEPPLSRREFEESGGAGSFAAPGLKAVRERAPFFQLPLLGPDTYPVSCVTALRSALAPGAVDEDPDRERLLKTLLSLPALPKMSNRAAMGFGFGRQYSPVSIAAVTAGGASGGTLEPYTSPLGTRVFRPSDPAATYGWVEFDRTEPPGVTDLGEFSRSWFSGPGLDFAEWYFPARLLLDVGAAATLVLKEDDWPRRDYGLRASRGAEMDLPILGMSAAAPTPGQDGRFASLRRLVSRVPIGPGRPAAGATRDEERAFQTVGYGEMTHIDPIAAADVAGGAGRGWYNELSAFILQHTPAGGVVVPRRSTP